MKLAAERWGKPGHPKILLLHGMGGTGALWRPIAADLEDSFDILAPDQRGHGQSRPCHPDSYSPLDYGQDCVDTLQQTGFHPCVVVGHSMGVRTACALAHLRPEWVQGLVLIDLGMDGLAGGGLGENLGNFIRVLPQSFSSRDEARAFMNAHCPDPSIAQYLMAVSRSEPSPSGLQIVFPFDSASLLQTIEAARGVSLKEWVNQAARAGIRVLALRGARSKVWSAEAFESDKRLFDPALPIQFEEIADAGHGLPFERRAAFIARLQSFIH